MDFGIINQKSLKQIFDNEENFNNWLADNLGIFSEIFTADFTNPHRESHSEGFLLDILAEVFDPDEDEKHYVAIESQLGRSDHKHLGQLLTYGQQYNAIYCIWIADSFHPDHLKVIETLNETSNVNRHYYAISPEIFSIDDGRNVIRLRQETTEQIYQISKYEQGNTIKGNILWEFFDLIRKELITENWFRRGTSTKDRWYYFGSGKSGVSYGWRFYIVNGEDRFAFTIVIGTDDREETKEYCKTLENAANQEFSHKEYEIAYDFSKKFQYIYFNYPEPVEIMELGKSSEAENLKKWAISTLRQKREKIQGYINDL